MISSNALKTIKLCLATNGAMTCRELVEKTGLKEPVVRSALKFGVTKVGGVCLAGRKGRHRLYGLLALLQTPQANVLRRYQFDFKPLTRDAYDPFAHRNLAMLARKKP